MASGLLARREQTAIFLLHASAGIAGPVAFPEIGAMRRAHIFPFDLGNAALKPRRELNDSDRWKRKHWEALLDHETGEVHGTFYYPKKEGGFWTGYPNGIITNITDMRLNNVHPQFPIETPKQK